MPGPRRYKKNFGEPPIRCFKPDTKNKGQFDDIKINLDEFEAVRL